MAFNPTISEIEQKAKKFIDASVWDGEDRTGAVGDSASFSPDELQLLVNDLILHLREEGYI